MPKKGHRYPESERARIYATRKGPRPHCWVMGLDPVTRAKGRAYTVARCAARFRGEQFELSFADYVAAWGDSWHRRGRQSTGLCLTRVDRSLPWRVGNTRLVERGHHARQLNTTRHVADGI